MKTIISIITATVKPKERMTSLDTIYRAVWKCQDAKESTIERKCRILAEWKIIEPVFDTAKNGREFIKGYKLK